MKTNFKYIWLLFVFTGLVACDDEELVAPDLTAIEYPELNANGLDFSKYVSLGASFTAGFSDGALFQASQVNSFPNQLAEQFAKVGGGNFTQPLMSDNIGGLLNTPQLPRLYFYSDQDGEEPNLTGPYRLGIDPTNPDSQMETPTTTVANLGGAFTNMGVPGAKSFHLLAPGYGNPAGLVTNPVTANPYFVRMASSANASILEDAMSQAPTFFTLSEIGGNDVLGYAISGGDGSSSITPSSGRPGVGFDQTFGYLVNTLTSGGAKGVITTVPNIASLPHFTTVPHNPLDPSNESYRESIPTLNTVYGALNDVYAYLQSVGVIDNAAVRTINFSTSEAGKVVIIDESLSDLSAQIAATLKANPSFPAFVARFGLPAAAAPSVADLLGQTYGQTRAATENDLLVLPSSSVIGKVNTTTVQYLMERGLPQAVAGQFSVEGITLPLADKWVLTPEEQTAISTAVDSYNATIRGVAVSNDNVALVDLNKILQDASTAGIRFGDYTLTTNLVTGGLVSLDGIHLTSRGYGLMAQKFLEAIDAKFGSNFIKANAIPDAGSLRTNYPASLK